MNTKLKVSKKRSRTILSILLIAAILITGAFAFLTAQDSKTNVFTVGNVSIKLTERFDTDLSGSIDETKEIYDSSDERITLTDGKSVVPGQKVIKSPYVENVGTNEAWTYVVVGIPTTNSDSAFYNNETGQTAITGQEVSITITAYAIQDKYKNKTTSEDIWNAYITGKEVAIFGNVETSSENLSSRVPLFTVLSDYDFDSTTQVVDNSYNNEWTMLSHNIDGKSTNVYRSADGYDYYVFGYNSKLAAPTEGEDSVKTTPVFKGVKLQKDIGGARPSVLNYYVVEQTGNTAAGETDLLSTNSVPEGYTLLKTEYYMPGSSIPTLYYDETLSKTGYSFDWSIMDDNGEATTNYAYSGMSITGDTNLLAVYTDTVKQDSVSTPNPITEYTPSGYLTYSIERDDAGNMYANLVGANRNASDYPATETEVIVPNYVKVLNNNGDIVLAEGYVENSYVSANDIPTGGVSIPVKKIQLAEWQWNSSTNDYASDEAVALGQIAKKLNIAGTNIESIKFCGDIYQHNITSGFVLEDIGTIPFSCTELDDRAFYECIRLKQVTLPKSLIDIGYSAFEDCYDLENIIMQNSVMKVGERAFANCSKLKNIVLSTEVSVIEQSTFLNCRSLLSIDISERISSIEHHAFEGCNSLVEIALPNNLSFIGTEAFHWCYNLSNVVIPNGIEVINFGAFNCTGIENINIPDSVKIIQTYAFASCNNLKEITVGKNVIDIEADAFSWCDALSNIDVDAENPKYASNDGILYTKDFSEILQYPAQNTTKNVVLPEGLKTLSERTFVNNEYIESVYVPKTVEKIDSGFMYQCRNVDKISVDLQNKSYDSRGDCNAIIETATNKLIFGCSSTVIPQDITTIGEWAFWNSAPYEVTLSNSITKIEEHGLSVCKINIPSLDYWLNLDHEQVSGTLYINEGPLTSVIIPEGTTKITKFAFANQSQISNIVMHQGIKSIDDCAFGGCKGLTSITIPDSVTSIGERAFSNCTGLTSITIPDNVTSIGTYAFSGCTGLTSVTIGNSVTSIGSSAFSGCTGLTSITIPDSVTSIGYWAFENCNKLTSIIVNQNNSKYDSRNGCNAIIETETNTLVAGCKTTVIPDSVTGIGAHAFNGCTNLTSITIPDSVTSIGIQAFDNCESLTNVTYQGTLSDWAKVNCPPGSFASGVTITCTDGTVTTQ